MLFELFEAVIQHSGIGEYLGAMGQGCETVKAQGLRAGVQCTEVIFQRGWSGGRSPSTIKGQCSVQEELGSRANSHMSILLS